MNVPTPSPCYQLSRTVMGEHLPMDNLRLETDSGSFYLFSYHHLDFAKFDSDKGRDALTLSFLGHQVRIAGRNLRELAIAIQKRAVESIQTMPTRYSGAAGNAASFVESIEIESVKDQMLGRER
jgi:hypothetical protein